MNHSTNGFARAAALLLLLCTLSPGVRAQSEEVSSGEEIPGSGQVGSSEEVAPPDNYVPLFTPEMIEAADPSQAERMRATEARNRETWEERRNAAAAQARAAQPAPAAAPPRRASRKKIYRWVDKDGNVNFGDAPGGKDATEVKVGGVARQRGQPPRAPSLINKDQ